MHIMAPPRSKSAQPMESFLAWAKIHCKFIWIAGEGPASRPLVNGMMQFPRQSLHGFCRGLQTQAVLVVDENSSQYLQSLSPEERRSKLQAMAELDPPIVILSGGHMPDEEIKAAAQERGWVLAVSSLDSTRLQFLLLDYLEEYFAPELLVHGSLVDVYGVGMLYTGKSGIGKSECVLDLVGRGHRLVGDDVISLRRKGYSVFGQGNSLLGHYMEIRGVGVIDIERLFGIRAIRRQKRVEIEVELVSWDARQDYERLGIKGNKTEILGVEVDKVIIPISPGKNITVISEVIAMNLLLRMNGIDSAWEFSQKLLQQTSPPKREFVPNLGDKYE